MIALLVQTYRLVRAVVGVVAEPRGRALALLVTAQLLTGTLFFVLAEGWGWLDALYFCVMVLTTIGLGDLAPATDLGKAFTTVYALVGIGLVAAFISLLAARFLEDAGRRADGTKKSSAP